MVCSINTVSDASRILCSFMKISVCLVWPHSSFAEGCAGEHSPARSSVLFDCDTLFPVSGMMQKGPSVLWSTFEWSTHAVLKAIWNLCLAFPFGDLTDGASPSSQGWCLEPLWFCCRVEQEWGSTLTPNANVMNRCDYTALHLQIRPTLIVVLSDLNSPYVMCVNNYGVLYNVAQNL